MNAVQIIHKHIMLRFCVVLLAIFVAFGAFTSTCFADDPLGRQITVAVGGTIGSGLGSLAGGSIAAAGVSAVGLPAAAPIASKVGSGLVGSAGGVVGGLFAGKLYDFLTGYDGDANEESFKTSYSQWVDENDVNGAYDKDGHYIAHFTCRDYSNNKYTVAGDNISEPFYTDSLPYDRYILKFNCPKFFGLITRGTYRLARFNTAGNAILDSVKGSFSTESDISHFYTYSTNSSGSSFQLYLDLYAEESHSAVFLQSVYDQLCASLSNFYLVSNSIYTDKNSSYRVGSVSSGVSVAKSLVSSIGGSSKTVGCIDAATLSEASNFYTIPLMDEDEKTLILPDGTTIAYDDVVYDYTTRTYYITYDTSKTYQITYNYDNCVVNNGTASNIYYYAIVDANTPTYDKDGNQTGGTTTDPDNPNPSNPDTPSGGDNDNSGSIWDKVVDAIAGLFTAIGKVIGGLLESVINLFTGIVDGLTGCLDLFGSFGEFVAGFYTWMPEEWRTVLAAAFTIFIGLAVVKLFRGS